MSVQPPQQATPAKRSVSTRTLLLIVFVIVLTVFAMMNRDMVHVWPLGMKPLILVIAISFVLGALIGWLLRSLTMGHTPRRTSE